MLLPSSGLKSMPSRKPATYHLLIADFLLDLLFKSEDGGGKYLPKNMALQPGRSYLSINTSF
jgi:hypothetical protein